jgi:hypothetical protein
MKKFFIILILAIAAIILFSCENNDEYMVKNVKNFAPRVYVENVDAIFSTNSTMKSTSESVNIYTYTSDGLIDMIKIVDENGDTVVDGFNVISLEESFDLNNYYAYFKGDFSIVVGVDLITNENIYNTFNNILVRKNDGRIFDMPYDIDVIHSTMYSLNSSFEYDILGNLYFTDVEGDVYKFNGNNENIPDFKFLFNQYITDDPHNEGIAGYKPYMVIDEDYLILHSSDETQMWVYKNDTLKHYDYFEQYQTNTISFLWTNNIGNVYTYIKPDDGYKKLCEVSFSNDSVIITDIEVTNVLNSFGLLSTYYMKTENGDSYFINQNGNNFIIFDNETKTLKQYNLPVNFVENFNGNNNNTFAISDSNNIVVYYNSITDNVISQEFDENVVDVTVTNEQSTTKSSNENNNKIVVVTETKIYTIDIESGVVQENEKIVDVENLIGI